MIRLDASLRMHARRTHAANARKWGKMWHIRCAADPDNVNQQKLQDYSSSSSKFPRDSGLTLNTHI